MSKQNCLASPSVPDSNVISLKPARSVRYRIGALVIAAALVALATSAGLKSEPAGSQSGATVQAAQDPDASTEFVYFPGQYVNQAIEPTGHIQAF